MASPPVSTEASFSLSARPSRLGGGRVLAVLGPTNTGKTHFAVERMLGHASGVIGLPLRLLAREVYDRVVALKGRTRVALITGEEKIMPANPSWFVCTVESMPLDRSFDFLAVDEIQLAADPERGHVFTDRLLHARGREETLLIGALTVRPLIQRLAPEAEIVTRPRFSILRYAGPKKLSRLAPRSVVVAFSADEVYAIAELIRGQRGGAAVVMGALSPRTRNAQVALYQSGEVDFLVATDAIGMGLNMDVDHVAFAGLRKFDGQNPRPLNPAEIGQIAGRAGRYLSPGSFGVTGDAGEMPPDVVERVENHRFDALTSLRWRNGDLDFDSINALLASLETKPPAECLRRGRDGVDYLTLRALGRDPEIRRRASARARVRLLWQVCQLPDFRQVLHDSHVQLAAKLFHHLTGPEECLPADWVARQLTGLDRVDGDIDALSNRLAFIRTWTYISHRADWLRDAAHWQERARDIEDRLSDALHGRLTQRFVDTRQAALFRRLKDRPQLEAAIAADGEVLVEGQSVGRLRGLRFVPDALAQGADGRTLRTVAARTLGKALEARAGEIAREADSAFSLSDDGLISWRGDAIARLQPGRAALGPRLGVLAETEMTHGAKARVAARLGAWLERTIEKTLWPLKRLANAALTGPAAGLSFQLAEGLGAAPRRQVAALLSAMEQNSRRRLQAMGVQFGQAWIYLPATLRPDAARLKSILWWVHSGAMAARVNAPSPPAIQKAGGHARDAWSVAGYAVIGEYAVPIARLERFARRARALTQGTRLRPTEELRVIMDGPWALTAAALQSLGYAKRGTDFVLNRRPSALGKASAGKDIDGGADTPFARLKELAVR